MDNIVYDNGSFYVYTFTWHDRFRTGNVYTAYGIKRTDRPQDGMIFSHTNLDYCKKIADDYNNSMG